MFKKKRQIKNEIENEEINDIHYSLSKKGHKMEINDIHDPVSKMRTPGNDAPDLRMSVYIYMYVYIYIYMYLSLSLWSARLN